MLDLMFFAAEATSNAGTAATMAVLLETVTSVLTSAVSWVSSVTTAISGSPILLLGVVLPFVGFGVGLFKRMLNV